MKSFWYLKTPSSHLKLNPPSLKAVKSSPRWSISAFKRYLTGSLRPRKQCRLNWWQGISTQDRENSYEEREDELMVNEKDNDKDIINKIFLLALQFLKEPPSFLRTISNKEKKSWSSWPSMKDLQSRKTMISCTEISLNNFRSDCKSSFPKN